MIVHVVHAAPPIALARLAPLVSVAARAGDAAAGTIVSAAATALAADVHAIRRPEECTPIVLAGRARRAGRHSGGRWPARGARR
jgi:N-acetylglucosamine kinase-like BadF-type ATPase